MVIYWNSNVNIYFHDILIYWDAPVGSLHDKLEPSFQDVYTKKLSTLSGKIMSDTSHILYEVY